ncbi:LEA type 2 family protein [Gemmatimonadota bacterium]
MSKSRIGPNGQGPLRLFSLALALAALQGCALLFTPPEVRIVGVELATLGLSSGTAEVVLEVTNNGSRNMAIQGFAYALEVREGANEEGWKMLTEGFHSQEVSLSGNEVRRVRVPVPFEYEALGTALRSFLSRGEVPYRLSGEVRIGSSGMGLQVPFRSQGVLKP